MADIVQECSDDKTLSQPERKRMEAENISHKSRHAKLVKIADKTSNLRAILVTPPEDWDNDRKAGYFTWAKTVIDGCRGVNAGLEKEFDTAYKRGMQAFGMQK